MKKIGIFYFSGTGTTEIIVEMAKKEFEETGATVELIRIEEILKKEFTPEIFGFDIIGISNPVLGFGTPDIVFKFIHMLPYGGGKKVFLLKTAGGVGKVNYPSSRPVIRKLRRKNYDVFYDRLLSLGCNWVVKFDERITRRLYEANRKKIKTTCIEIFADKRRSQNAGKMVTMLMEVLMFIDHFFMRFIGLDMYTTKACNHCSVCVRGCPVGNITDKNGKLHFGLKCNCCMRCVYTCPREAIRFRLFSFFIVRGGYDIRKIIVTDTASTDLSGVWKPAFFDTYVTNDNI